MKCHYEVLDVPKDVDGETLKKSYRKLALKWHPDKNPENIDEATQHFRIIQQAYDVLSDPHERAWYDKHREAILRGGLGTGDYEDNCLNVFQYFSASCYSGYDDTENGFYTVYKNVFDKIAAEDMEFVDEKESDFEIPAFGDSTSPYEEVVHMFYSHWLSYCTMKSYVWVEKYDTREAPNRRISRLMEKENKKLRDQAKKKRNEEIRALVAFVRKRDKRVQAYRKLLEEKAAANSKKTEEMRLRQLQERRENLENYSESGWSAMSTLESELQEIEKSLDKQYGDEENDLGNGEENDEVIEDNDLYCIACEKLFRNIKGLENHMNSKKHKENIAILEEILEEEDQHVQSDESLPEFADVDGESNVEDDGNDAILKTSNEEDQNSSSSIPEELTRKKRQRKKQKKNSLLNSHTENGLGNSDEEDGSEKPFATDIDELSSKKQNKKRRNQRFCMANEDTFMNLASKEEVQGDGLSNTVAEEVQTESGPPAVKLKGKKAREARKKLKDQKAKQQRKEATDVPDEIRCATCNNEFPTRNKLFNHLKSTGHSVYISSSLDEQCSARQTGTKVKMKNKK